MESFGSAPLLSRIHPELKEAQHKVVRHFEQAYNIPVKKVKRLKSIKQQQQKLTYSLELPI